MLLREISNDEFYQFSINYPYYSIYQTKEYGLATNHIYHSSFFIGLENDYHQIVAASLIIVKVIGKLKYAFAPHGFLIDYEDYNLLDQFTKLLKPFLKKKGIISITISPLIWKKKYIFNNNRIITEINPKYKSINNTLNKLKYSNVEHTNHFDTFSPKYEAVLNINRNIVNTFSNIHKNYRTKIRSSDNKGVRIYKGNELQIPFMHEQIKNKYPKNKQYIETIYNYFAKSNMVEMHFAVLEPTLYLRNIQIKYQKKIIDRQQRTDAVFNSQSKNNEKLITKKIEADNALVDMKKKLIDATNLLRDYPNGIITACAITIKYRDNVYLYLDSFDHNYKSLNSRQLLIWKLIDKYTKEGYKLFYLGTMDNPLEKNNNYKKLNHSKLSLGCNCTEYIGDFELIINNPLYLIAKKR